MSIMQTLSPPPAKHAGYAVNALNAAARDEFVTLKLRSLDFAESRTPAKRIMWDAFLRNENIGYAGLEFAPAEFDLSLTHYGPAFRLYIAPKYRFRGLGSKLARAVIHHLRAAGFSRPLLASHIAGDSPASHILSQCGFLYTGCKTREIGGLERPQMVAFL